MTDRILFIVAKYKSLKSKSNKSYTKKRHLYITMVATNKTKTSSFQVFTLYL